MRDNMEETQLYAIGQQDFKTLREEGYVYVDKTMYIDIMVRRKMQYLFLARPRRFGKSLFLSTLRYFFEGRRELFKGLYIASTGYDWQEYPVLYLDLNPDRYTSPENLDNRLEELFSVWEREYEVAGCSLGYPQRFRSIIEAAHAKTGKKVVILVDEYDKPLVTNLGKEEEFEGFREKLASIYSNFKSSAEHIRFVMLTGVSRFSKLSVFSDTNNIKDITFNDDFADICGITEKEIHTSLRPGILRLAEKEGTTYEEACAELKLNYDGYRFTRTGSDIYNPWSVLNCMQDSAIEDYWVRTGKPTIVAKALRNKEIDLEKILNTQCRLDLLQGLDLDNADPLALLFQTGYLTIKEYDKETRLYRLGVPNQEVTRGLFNELLPYYVNVRTENSRTIVEEIVMSMVKGEPTKMMESMDIFLAGIPYEMRMEDENNFHNALYILLTLIGAQVETETHTSDGRIDLLVKTSRYIYVIELKFGKDSTAALRQIEEKRYELPFLNDPRRLFLIGANFNKETRRLDAVEIREVTKSDSH